MFSELAECHEGKVVFVVTKEMIDEFIEMGFYSFQIRLYDSAEMKSRVTIPPVMNGFDIRNPIAAEDETNVVDQGIVDYARIFKDQSNEELPTFTWDGEYVKTEWAHHDVITENKMNKIEDALYSINANIKESDVVMLNTLDQVKKDADTYVKEHMAEVEADVEEFERNLNTDVQQFKIDTNAAMTAHKNEVSEELESVNSQLAHIGVLSVKDFGAVGDGVTDDTLAIKSAFSKLNDGYEIKFEKNKTYIINSPITTNLSNNKNIAIDFNSSTIKLGKKQTYYGNGLLGFKFDKTITDTSVDIKNGNFDISINEPIFTEDADDSVLFGGGGVLLTYGARLVNIDNCKFNDVFFSSAINVQYGDIINISNCTGVNVGGMAPVSSNDRAGDAIYLSKCGVYGDTSDLVGGNDKLNKEVSVAITNCDFKSYEAVEATSSAINTCHSGRCGIVVGEYSSNSKNKKLKMVNCSFDNYQRTLHLEFTKGWNILIENTAFHNFGDAIFITHDNTWKSIICRNVEFAKDIDVRGMFSNGGYVLYTGTDVNYKRDNTLKFENCNFEGKIKFFRGNSTHWAVLDNCRVVSDFFIIENGSAKFINCNIKANKGKVDNSILSMDSCYVEMGYLHNDDSNYYFGSSVTGKTSSLLSDLSYFFNCTFKNATFAFNNGNRIHVRNCNYILDDNFAPKTALGVDISGIIYTGFKDVFNEFTNNVVNSIKESSSIPLVSYTFTNENINGNINIASNIFNGCYFNANNVGSYTLKITDNYFNLGNTNLTYYIRNANGGMFVYNNTFTGLSSGEISIKGISKNNYRYTDNVITEI